MTFDGPGVDLGELVEPAEAEAQCCSFCDMAMHIGPPLVLDVRAPDDALGLVHGMFGEPAA